MGPKNSKEKKSKSKNLKDFNFDTDGADLPNVEEYKDVENTLDQMRFNEDESRVSSHSVSVVRIS